MLAGSAPVVARDFLPTLTSDMRCLIDTVPMTCVQISLKYPHQNVRNTFYIPFAKVCLIGKARTKHRSNSLDGSSSTALLLSLKRASLKVQSARTQSVNVDRHNSKRIMPNGLEQFGLHVGSYTEFGCTGARQLPKDFNLYARSYIRNKLHYRPSTTTLQHFVPNKSFIYHRPRPSKNPPTTLNKRLAKQLNAFHLKYAVLELARVSTSALSLNQIQPHC